MGSNPATPTNGTTLKPTSWSSHDVGFCMETGVFGAVSGGSRPPRRAGGVVTGPGRGATRSVVPTSSSLSTSSAVAGPARPMAPEALAGPSSPVTFVSPKLPRAGPFAPSASSDFRLSTTAPSVLSTSSAALHLRMLSKGGRQVAVVVSWSVSWSGTRYTCSKNNWLSIRLMWSGAWW